MATTASAWKGDGPAISFPVYALKEYSEIPAIRPFYETFIAVIVGIIEANL
jgi:hypothetical protein